MSSENSTAQIDIWIIEDNLRYRKTLAGLIDRTPGMKCSHSFPSCEDALELLTQKNSPEIILLDIGLPGMSGIMGIEKFKAISPSAQILILTVYDDNDNVFDALCAGASGYLLKDSSPEKIIDSIKEVLAGGAPMNMKIAHKVLEMFARLKPKKNDYGLTEREKEILQYIISGITKQQIADKIFLSFHTVNTHVKNIYKKLHVNTQAGVISKVYKENLLFI
ncbi:MAG: response regulator transcription factor [Ignavibacteriales bacterium]|nr:response regulator transcription factor [Ignavibacteriales bacterium]